MSLPDIEQLRGKVGVECDIWAENPRGEKTVPGKAIVIVPSRGSPAS